MTTTFDPTANGHPEGEGAPAASGAHRGGAGRDTSLAPLRERPTNVHVLGGYGPLVVGLVLFALMVVLAPTVAPERIVERPVDDPAVTTTVSPPATTTTLAADADAAPGATTPATDPAATDAAGTGEGGAP